MKKPKVNKRALRARKHFLRRIVGFITTDPNGERRYNELTPDGSGVMNRKAHERT